ncbi:MAG: ChaN family lipoprotein [Hyphomicrobiales bacterium]|nr:ChaN family lipoprotein [Hyphomicrobiales bacterium]
MMLFSLLTLAFAASARAEGATPWQNWQTSLQAGDALVGKIWSAQERRFVSPRSLAHDLAEAKYVLIGEVHDNSDHHRLQAWLIDQIAIGRKPAVVMEMIGLDQSKTLDVYLADPDANAVGLGPALGWAERGWPDWPLYQPIAEAVFRAGLHLLPGGPSRAAVQYVASHGLDSIEGAERKRLGLDRPLPPKLGDALRQDIEESHCNLLPEAALGPMTQAQRYRDAKLASALVRAGKGDGAVLIAGNGHVRSDRGVPWYLAHQAAEARVSSVMLLEITDDARTVEDLVKNGPEGEPAADYFWITPRAEREDQCEKLRRHFQK